MPKYIIDTNTCIEYFKKRNGVPERMDSVDVSDLCVSEVTIAELLYGAVHSKSVERHLQEVRVLQNDLAVIPISDTLDDYAEIRHSLTLQGLSIEDFDILIGAAARHFGLTVVTDNVRHFSCMPNVRIENWVNRSGD